MSEDPGVPRRPRRAWQPGVVSENTSIPAVEGRCDECGFDYERVSDADVPAALRRFGQRYRAPLTRGLPGEALGDLLRAHPQEGVWSALEYACHVRDVFDVQRQRIERMLTEDLPTHEPMDREDRVTRDAYNDQDPVAVADQLAANAETLATTLEALDADQWKRPGIYTYPEPTERDVSWVARHTAHEGQHHLLDIGRSLRSARGR